MSTKTYIDCSWGKVHYLDINKDAENIILCLHGWMDNLASFEPLSHYLNHRLICLDLPGHGFSDHLPEGNSYHFIDYIVRLREITNNLKLEKFHILGHSMGAAIGSLYSATFPEHTLSLTMIDGLGPLVNPPEDARDILRTSILKTENKNIRKRTFKNLELAVKARLSAGSISHSSAELLVKNQTEQKIEGIVWTYDYKLKETSKLRISPLQLDSFLKELKCPSLLILADEGLLINSPYLDKINLIQKLCIKRLKGNHHIHMDSPKECAEAIELFLNKPMT